MAEKKPFGVAFSGGGIRSAAFCSGVLRRLLTQEMEPDYLSCVSGGGYTGSAYVQWKYSKGEDYKPWANLFFNHMRERSGYICNWNKGICCENNDSCENCKACGQGCLDTFILGCLLFFVTIVIPVIGWGSFAFPIAFMVKLFYGNYLDGTLCRNNPDSTDCNERSRLFTISIITFLVFRFLDFLITRCGLEKKENYQTVKWIKILLRLVQLISGASFAFTFLPWFIKDFLQYTHWFYSIAIVAVSALFWFFVPVLRRYSSLVIVIYSYSYVVYWHLFEEAMFKIKYDRNIFITMLGVSLIICALASVFGDFQLRLVHIYNRWRLQQAFYYNVKPQGRCKCGCSGIVCYDLFPGCCCAPNFKERQHQVPTLEDCEEVTPVYISNMVVNNWRRKYKEKYCILTMSPKGIAVLGQLTGCAATEMSTSGRSDNIGMRERSSSGQDNASTSHGSSITNQPIGTKLTPNDIKLSSAMAMSAAAVSPYLGAKEELERPLTHVLTVLGWEMAATIVYDMENHRKREPQINQRRNGYEDIEQGGTAFRDPEKCCPCEKVCCICLNLIIFTVFSALGFFLCIKKPPSLIYSFPANTTRDIIIVSVLVVCWVVLLVCMVWDWCNEQCSSSENELGKKLNDCSRWATVHLPIYRFIRYILNIITEGPGLPALLHLSDGGHYENYGLLPLLELKLPKILVADGSHIASDEDYGKQIIHAMELARDLLSCSFTAMDGGDVLTDIEEKYLKPQNGKYTRKYEFKVQYKKDPSTGRRKKGHITLIAPRPPRNDIEVKTWEQVGEVTLNGEENIWGEGPFLSKGDVDRIAGCPRGVGCCECCHDWCCSFKGCCSSSLAFPRHSTANQFFTPTMFATYHREGYRACMEAYT